MTSSSFELLPVNNGMASADTGGTTSGTSMPIAGAAMLEAITQDL